MYLPFSRFLLIPVSFHFDQTPVANGSHCSNIFFNFIFFIHDDDGANVCNVTHQRNRAGRRVESISFFSLSPPPVSRVPNPDIRLSGTCLLAHPVQRFRLAKKFPLSYRTFEIEVLPASNSSLLSFYFLTRNIN